MKRFFSEILLLAVVLLPLAVSAAVDTIVPCSECSPAIADTWPHTGQYGAGTRYFYLHNYWHKDLTVRATGSGMSFTFPLKIGHDTILQIPNTWASARIWGYWDPKYQNGPFSLAEINMDSRTAANWHTDWYDVSLVDGYNLPLLFYPLPGTFYHDSAALDEAVQRTSQFTCGGKGDCVTDLYLTVPASMLKLDTINGVLDTNGIYCQDNTQCRALKKAACPTSYSFALDDPASLFTCPSPNLPASLGDYAKYGPDYVLDFGFPPTSPVISDNKPTMNYAFVGNTSVTITKNREVKYLYGGGEPATLEIYSCSGKLVFHAAAKESGCIAVPYLNSGLYIVTLKSAHMLATKQMLVSR
ncbi:MAG TPA: thaumatin family protein [Chitinivibrionales bacterium]|nr:thaumatin family protein [Chitinivibrionales bacterium]